MMRLEYIGNNARGQSVYNVRADGECVGQLLDRGRQGYRAFVGYYWHDFLTIRGFMDFFRHEAETRAQG